MLLVGREPIGAEDTTAALHDRLAALGGRLVVEALAQAAVGPLQATPQPEAGVNYAHKIDKAEAAIDWTLPATQIARRVRAFDPFPGCSFALPGGKPGEAVKVWAASVVPASGRPGELLQAQGDTLIVACGEQALALHTLQKPGGKRQATREFLQSTPLPASLT
jgi:methionyl-tRNA formyltransferase